MNRQKFLGTLFVLPIGVFLVHCGSSGSGGSSDTNAPAAPPTMSGTQDVYSSSMAQSHFHTFMVEDMSFTAPPASGVSGDTGSAMSHTHTVSISSAQLQQVAMGQSIEVTTSSVSSHTHTFTFMKVG